MVVLPRDKAALLAALRLEADADAETKEEAVIELTGTGLADGEASEVAGAMQWTGRRVVEVRLGGNKLGAAGASKVAQAVVACEAVRVVMLGDNPRVGDAGVVAWALAMERAPGLEVVELDGCGVSDGAAAELARGMGASPSLTRLVLARNRIADAGASALARGMAACPSLVCLDLACNFIGASGAAELLASFRAHPSARELDLSSNDADDEAVCARHLRYPVL